MPQSSIYDQSLDALQEQLRLLGEPPYRATQLFRWLYRHDARCFEAMSDLPEPLRVALAQRWTFAMCDVVERRQDASDGATRCVLRLADGETIESVLIPTPTRLTGCLSTQVGCKFACTFCASGAAGFVRNLSTGEILQQVLWLRRLAAPHRLTHLVFMGIGEPLDNYEALVAAIRVLTSPVAFGMSPHRLTVSTCGVAPKIERLARERLRVNLSVSLHAATDRLRSRLMPVNRAYPIARLFSSCRDYRRAGRRPLTFEYILLEGENDRPSDADRLALRAKPLSAKVNLIPYNPVDSLSFQRPSVQRIEAFRHRLTAAGVVATVRWSRGGRVDGACGQLRIRRLAVTTDKRRAAP